MSITIATKDSTQVIKYLKSKVYQHCPQTLEASKKVISIEVDAVMLDMTPRVMNNFLKRTQPIHQQWRQVS